MDGVLVTVGTELFQLDPASGVTPVLLSGVARYSIRALGRVGTAFSTLQGDDEADAFGHDRLPRLVTGER